MPYRDQTYNANEIVLDARVKREREAFDNGLQRDTYDDVLSHCQFYWRREVLRLFREALSRENVNDVLEIGSHGWDMVFNEQSPPPPNFSCINISEAELDHGRRKASSKGYAVKFHRMDAHQLNFDDNSFDAAFGFGILHHLEYETALDEIRRVLRPGGIMIFNEPLDVNPVGALVRMATPEARTPDESPLKLSHLALFRERFDVSFYPQQFLSVPFGVFSRFAMKTADNKLMRAAFSMDKALSGVPGVRFWFRKVVIIGAKRAE